MFDDSEEITPEVIAAYQQMVREYPLEYCKHVLGVNLWSRQQDIMKAFADPKVRYLSIRSGNGVGKTFMLSSLVCQYLDTHCPGYAVISGSSWTGVLKTIWPSLRTLISNAPVRLGGEVLGTDWRRGNMWGAFCVSPDKPENISGMRTKNGALVLIDEASALTDSVHEAIMGLCSAAGSKIVYSGNPIRAEGPFYETFSDTAWANFHISSEEAADQNIPGLATWEWINDLKKKWGEDDPRFKARVKGIFPEDVFDALVKLPWVKAILVPRVLREKGHCKMGVDIAARGDDKTVIVVRDDHCVRYVEAHNDISVTAIIGRIKNVAGKFNVRPRNIFVDATGVGNSHVELLWEDKFEVNGINFANTAHDAETFANVRAEMYWAVREGFRPDSTSQRQFIPHEFSSITDECTKIKFKSSRSGKILIESKDEMKRRLGKSPDYADAYALSFCGSLSNFAVV